MKKVAIILVNWNGRKHLKDCLSSLKNQSYKGFDIILVDNNSTDGSLDNVRDKNVILIQNKENYGFAKGNNIGIQKAIKAGYEYIVLANYDTETDKEWLKKLVDRAESDPKIGAVQSKVLLADSKLINTTGSHLHFLGFSYCGDYQHKDTFGVSNDICAASGASVLLQTDVLKKIGLFDEIFFMYLEDTDLSWRIKEAGYSIVFEPESIIYHKYSFSKNKDKFYHSEKNRIIFILKNYELKTILLLLPAILITEILMIGYATLGGWLAEKLKGYKFIIKHRKEILKARHKVQAKRKIKDHDLKEYFSYKLAFNEVKNPLFKPLNLFFWLYWFLVKSFI